MNKTIVFQVFDWEKLGKAECIGEVIMNTNTILQESPNNASQKVQIPVWQLNLNTETDAWKDLHKMTGTKDKVEQCFMTSLFVHNSSLLTAAGPDQCQLHAPGHQRDQRPPQLRLCWGPGAEVRAGVRTAASRPHHRRVQGECLV